MDKDLEIRTTELSDEVVDQIIFGMENQEKHFLFDIVEGELVEFDTEWYSGRDVRHRDQYDSRRFVDLPEWRPVDGFHLMERFVAQSKNPVYRQELRDALNGGRGVFRRFKDVLKQHQVLERQWYQFKEREMRIIVRKWFAAIGEALDLDQLGEEPEETEELVLSDFVLHHGFGNWRQRIEEAAGWALESSLEGDHPAVKEYFLTKERDSGMDDEGVRIFHAETPAENFAGCIVTNLTQLETSRVLEIRFVYVEPEFRGLGLARLFFDSIEDLARREEVDVVLFQLLGTALFLQAELAERGFKECGRRFALAL
ncbi:MAG TPA: N-acetyltransferase [Sediminispirochaeta sp.]|nr:N-acetyltransferase [Sediminispirochaeta sp.]